MNTLENQYREILQDILHQDEFFVYNYRIQHDMNAGFPLISLHNLQWKDVIQILMTQMKEDENLFNVINQLQTQANLDKKDVLFYSYTSKLYDENLSSRVLYLEFFMNSLTLKQRQLYLAKTYHKSSYYTQDMSHEDLNKVFCPRFSLSLKYTHSEINAIQELPHVLAKHGLFLHIICELLNMTPSELILNGSKIYIQEEDAKIAQNIIKDNSQSLPLININSEFWPTLGGECGEGPLDIHGFFKGLSRDTFVNCLIEEDIQLHQKRNK